MNSGSDEQKICKDLVDKYPNLKDYKTGKRFKEILLKNVIYNMYPSGYLFDTVDFKMKK